MSCSKVCSSQVLFKVFHKKDFLNRFSFSFPLMVAMKRKPTDLLQRPVF